MSSDASSDGLFAGRHVLAELTGIEPALLDDAQRLEVCLRRSLTGAGATVYRLLAHRFSPHGVTVLALLAESHASIHTYPEVGAAFVDAFTCGDAADPELAVRRLATALGASSVTSRLISRGGATAALPPRSSE